ncbi:MAG: hypothetical protein H6760_00245 [Candidatus Nomurabacteria bacterium]|nr:MAG: hypothetical protein H6760_00245 [Candidatus Nomurabacteria bacterium]
MDDKKRMEQREAHLPTQTVIAGVTFGILVALVLLLFAGFTFRNIAISLFLFGMAGGLIGLYMAVYQIGEIKRILGLFSPAWRTNKVEKELQQKEVKQEQVSQTYFWQQVNDVQQIKELQKFFTQQGFQILPSPQSSASPSPDFFLATNKGKVPVYCAPKGKTVTRQDLNELYQSLIAQKIPRAISFAASGYATDVQRKIYGEELQLLDLQDVLQALK